jgi:hypothetical protein
VGEQKWEQGWPAGRDHLGDGPLDLGAMFE